MIRTSRGRRTAAEATETVTETNTAAEATETVTETNTAAEATETVTETAENVAEKRYCFALGAISALYHCPEGQEDEMANAAQMLLHICDHETFRPVLWAELAEEKAQKSGDTDRSLSIMNACLSGHDVLKMVEKAVGGNGLYRMHEIRRKFERVLKKNRARQVRKAKAA